MAFKLDKKDREILYQLDIDSRQSHNQMAKKVGLSREVVQYRIRRMEKENVIRGYFTLIDVTKLGYMNWRIFIKFQRNTLEDEKSIIEYYKSHPQFWWVDSIEGFRDLGLACWVRNIYEFLEIKEDLIRKFGNYLHDVQFAVYCKFYIYRRSYLMGMEKAATPPKTMFSKDAAVHDDKDIGILRLIAGNARMSCVEISRKTGISISNVIYRIRRMEKCGIIMDYRVMLNLEKMGYYWYKIEFQLANLGIKDDMLKYFERHPNIIYAYETISENDLEVEMEVESYEKFMEILNSLRELFGKDIKKYNYLLWYKEHKFIFMP